MVLVGAETFSTGHIALTAAIAGAAATFLAVALLRTPAGVLEAVSIGVLTGAAVFLFRKAANMPPLNDDGLPGFSANDWLAPVVTFVMVSLYGSVRPSGNERRFDQARATATVVAFVVNVVAI
jgi:ABC-type arginine transport system permease subunit